MSASFRPTHTFVLKVWHELGDVQGREGWRGVVRRLDAQPDGCVRDQDTQDVYFYGLDGLVVRLHTLLDDEV